MNRKYEVGQIYNGAEIIYIGPQRTKGNFKWRCVTCGYEFEAQVNNFLRSQGCPRCQGKYIVGQIYNGAELISDKSKGYYRKFTWRCTTCGREFDAIAENFLRSKGCPFCSAKRREKERMEKKKKIETSTGEIHIGEIYEDIQFLGTSYNRGYKTHFWKCTKCGYEFETDWSNLKRSGCPHCSAARREKERMEEIESHIGETFGSLTVTGFAGFEKNKNGSKSPTMTCHCSQCGGDSVILLTSLLNHDIKTCKKCAQKNLEAGQEAIRTYRVEGTDISAIDGRRAMNRNNSTGHTGVSYHRQTGKYRAYIYFRRKQYHLGEYDNIEDAAKARENAEKEIYGNFLDWYAATYPEQWKRLSQKGDEN